jgi:pimeloyl-ACP methyl ester carboxylesterase
MPGSARNPVADLRGAARMAVDATAAMVDVVERMHRTILARPAPFGAAVGGATRGITGLVYRSVRGGTRLVGRGIDASLRLLEEVVPDGASTAQRDALLAIANGVYGDYLHRTRNPLAIEMSLRHRGRTLDVSDPVRGLMATGALPNGRILVLIHGLCMNDRQWRRDGVDRAAELGEALGYTPLHLRYNTGLHVWENGERLAGALESLAAHWSPAVDEIAIVGHSMGGLVARSACRTAGEQGHAWLECLSKLVFLGTPHHGAPLERGGHGVDLFLSLSPYSAPLALGKARSAGIQDLRHGRITAGGHRPVPLPAHVQCYAAAAALASRRGRLAERLVGDGLVPLDSALGRHTDGARRLRIPREHQWIGYEMGHLALLHRPEVYAQLRTWLQAPRGAKRA